MGKYGLSGNDGMVADGLHIAAPYDSNGDVFVEIDHEDYGVVWKRVPPEQARSLGLNVIKCSMCEKPAVSLDHYWPYYSEFNRCADHFGKNS